MKWYQLTFKQIQPLHLGGLRWGVISDTRIFITGQTIWGALTNVYAPYTNSFDPTIYEENGKIFQTITCFYPTIDDKILFPKYKDGEFYLGDYSEKQFRYEFTDTLISTSIIPGHRAAKDESLHEVTTIIPSSKTDKKELYWTGILGIEDESGDRFLKEDLEIYIGGEITYGLGLVKLTKKENISEDILTHWNIKLNADKFSILNYNDPITNYLKFSDTISFDGELELLADIDYKQASHLANANYYINPGSKVNPVINLQEWKLEKGRSL